MMSCPSFSPSVPSPGPGLIDVWIGAIAGIGRQIIDIASVAASAVEYEDQVLSETPLV